jgi:hypothetical protein
VPPCSIAPPCKPILSSAACRAAGLGGSRGTRHHTRVVTHVPPRTTAWCVRGGLSCAGGGWDAAERRSTAARAHAYERHAADDLLAAKAKNLDDVALAYGDMTRTCVKCHTHFRGLKKD